MTKQIVTGVEVIIGHFLLEVRKMLPSVFNYEAAFFEPLVKRFQ